MVQAKLLWRSVKIVLLIPKGSDVRKFSIAAGIQKPSILTVCCFSQIPKKRVPVQHFYIFIWYDCAVSKTQHLLMCPFNLNQEDITGDFKLVFSSEEDMLLHQSTVMI